VDADKWDAAVAGVRELCPGACPNMLHRDFADGSPWAMAHVAGGGDPDPVLRPKGKGPQAQALMRKSLREAAGPTARAACGVCGAAGRVDVSDVGRGEAVAPGDAGPGGAEGDGEDVLRPWVLAHSDFGRRHVAVRGALLACPRCRLLLSPSSYLQLVANHTLVHMTDGDKAGPLQEACTAALDEVASAFSRLNGRDGAGGVPALALLKAAMDGAYSVSSFASKCEGWPLEGEGGARMNARGLAELVSAAVADAVRGQGGRAGGGKRPSSAGRRKGGGVGY